MSNKHGIINVSHLVSLRGSRTSDMQRGWKRCNLFTKRPWLCACSWSGAAQHWPPCTRDNGIKMEAMWWVTLRPSPKMTIEWSHIASLHQLQEKEGLRAANKLSRAHVEYYRQVRHPCTYRAEQDVHAKSFSFYRSWRSSWQPRLSAAPLARPYYLLKSSTCPGSATAVARLNLLRRRTSRDIT